MDRSMERRQRRRFEDGEVIFKQNDAASEMYVVYEGKVRIYRERDGAKTDLATLGPGDFFGEMALFDDEPRSATARAVGPLEVRVITAETYAQLPCDPVVSQLLDTMASRLRAMDAAFERLSEESEARRTFMSNRGVQNYWLT
jgi:CRP/FNR family cyclic AMP-dependent transcriptional regulator